MKNKRLWWLIGLIISSVLIVIAGVLLALFWAGLIGENSNVIRIVMIVIAALGVSLAFVTVLIFLKDYKNKK